MSPYKFILLFLVFVLTFVEGVIGQEKHFDVKYLTRGDLSFPIFSSANNSPATKSINQLLQMSELYLLDGYYQNDIFEAVSGDLGGIYGSKKSISVEILENNQKILSLKFNESRCGLTCAYWVAYYNFNSGNGDLMQLEDYFSPEGFVSFYQQVLEKRTNKFKQEIVKVDTPDRDELLDVLECYKNDRLEDYYIQENAIFIDGENCLHKNQKFYGLDMLTKFDISEFKNYLNDYGKAIFGLTKDSISKYRSSSYPQLFEGYINNTTPILFVFKKGMENHVQALYAYRKYGRAIYLEGELVRNRLTLSENRKDSGEGEFIEASIEAGNIVGTWSDKKKSNRMSFFVKRRR